MQLFVCLDCDAPFEAAVASNGRHRIRCETCHKDNRRKVEMASYRRQATDPDFRARAVERARQWRLANPERHNRLQREWRARNRERVAGFIRDWAEANRDRRCAAEHRRRGRVRGAEGSFTAEEFATVCQAYDHRCAYCGSDAKLTMDHVVPLAHGGSNDIENIVPACRSCNARKGTKMAKEFLEMVVV